LQGVVVDSSSRVPYAVNFQGINKKAGGISKALRYLSHYGVLLNVTGFLRTSWNNKFSLKTLRYVFLLLSFHISFMFLCFIVNGREKE